MINNTPPVLKQLQCPNCGAPIQQHLATSQTVICSACSTYVSLAGEQPEKLAAGKKIPLPPVPLMLGTMLTLRGTPFFVMGRILYRGWDASEPSDRWHWTEWLLGANDGRLMWLSLDDDKGFVLFEKMRIRAPFNADSDAYLPLGDNKFATIKERYPAQILAAEGELTWLAKQGDRLTMMEGESNEFQVSIQKTAEELEIYKGTQLSEKELAEAAGDQHWLKRAESRSQASGAYALVGGIGIFLAIFALAIAAFAYSSGRQMTSQAVTLNREQPIATFPVVFERGGRPAMIKLDMQGSLPEGAFAEIDVNVVSPDGEDLPAASSEFWYETGYDDEGYWSESDYSGRGRFVPEKPGTYMVEVEMGEATVTGVQVLVKVYKNHLLYSWFVIYGLLMAGLGTLFLFIWYDKSKKVGV